MGYFRPNTASDCWLLMVFEQIIGYPTIVLVKYSATNVLTIAFNYGDFLR